ncbi:hypothetical protein AB0N07_30835 [Streptomyces sp. NPDC051172]|uniref:hypothetical protein n=1 Tax=Streptomyces sp. NPDC051172 TaxID=3155796 RepID=UPI00342500D7
MKAAEQLCAGTALACHDQHVANLSKVVDRLDAVMDLLGPVIGVLLLVVGIDTYRDGGSAWRRLAGRRNPNASS